MYAYHIGQDVAVSDHKPDGVEYVEIDAIPPRPEEGDYIWAIQDGALVWVPWADPEPVREPDPEADRDAMLVDLEYRTTLLELGVN